MRKELWGGNQRDKHPRMEVKSPLPLPRVTSSSRELPCSENCRHTAEMSLPAHKACGVNAQSRLVELISVRNAQEMLILYHVQGLLRRLDSSVLLQSCLTLATPRTAAHQAPLSTGFSRQELKLVAMSSSRESYQLRDQS